MKNTSRRPATIIAFFLVFSACLVGSAQPEKTSRFAMLDLKVGTKREHLEKQVASLLNRRNTYSPYGNNLGGGTVRYHDGFWILEVVYKAGSPAPTFRTPDGGTRSLPPIDETVIKFTIKNEIAESREFSDAVDRARKMMGEPLEDIRGESAGLRYLAVLQLNPRESKDHERALASVFEDKVRWVRYSAAVQLGKAGFLPDKVAPVLVEALGGEHATFHLWGTTNHVMPALYQVGIPAISHLTNTIDHPNDRLRENGCYVLGQLAGTISEREHFRKPLAALNAAIERNKYPTSRPGYVFTRMRIDGDIATAERLLSEDARSKQLELRLIALRQMRRFFEAADRIMPLLIESLGDDEPKVVRTSLSTIWSLHRKGEFDVSAAVPAVAVQLEQQKDYHLRSYCLRFLLDTGTAKHCPIEPVIKVLSEKGHIKAAAARVLGEMGPAAKSTLPQLRGLQDDPNKFVREAATNAITLINEGNQ